MKRVIFILACAVVAFHGLGAQQTIDDTRAREAAAVQLTATRHAPLPPNVSQYWFVQDVPGASAGEGRAKRDRSVPLRERRSGGCLGRLRGRIVAAERARSRHDAARRLHAVLHRGCARGSLAIRRGGRGVHLDDDVAPGRISARSRSSRLAEVAVARQDAARAETSFAGCRRGTLASPEDAWLALAQVEETLAHREHALELYRRIYYDGPLSAQAIDAQSGIERLQGSSVISADLVGTRTASRAASVRGASLGAGTRRIRGNRQVG